MPLQSLISSVAYLAPEIISRSGHNKTIDWYLLGVILYEMLVGVPPFYSQNRDTLFHNIVNMPLSLPSKISEEAKDLLRKVPYFNLF